MYLYKLIEEGDAVSCYYVVANDPAEAINVCGKEHPDFIMRDFVKLKIRRLCAVGEIINLK